MSIHKTLVQVHIQIGYPIAKPKVSRTLSRMPQTDDQLVLETELVWRAIITFPQNRASEVWSTVMNGGLDSD